MNSKFPFLLTSLLLANPSAAQLLDDNDDFDGFESFEIPTVITPTKLKQARTEVPAAVSIIDKRMIEASGVRDLPEIFRLVPGLVVGRRDGWNYVVAQHGAHVDDARRMQVLIDGRSLYPIGTARFQWSDIPLALEDIERIEISRGPNSATYGANSSLGVINIISSHPEESQGVEIKAQTGSENVEDYYARFGGLIGSNGSYRISYNSLRDSGFDEERFDVPLRDGKTLEQLTARLVYNMTDSWSIDAQLGYAASYKEEKKQDDYLYAPDYDNEDTYLSIKSNFNLSANNQLLVQLDHDHKIVDLPIRGCLPSIAILIPDSSIDVVTANPAIEAAYLTAIDSAGVLAAIAADPGDPFSATGIAAYTDEVESAQTALASQIYCTDFDESYTADRTDLQIQDTFYLNDSLRAVGGVIFSRFEVKSDTHFNGTETQNAYQAFTNIEYKPLDSLIFNIGGNYEYQQQLDHEFSPRVAANYLFDSQGSQSIRLILAKGYRNPDMLEARAEWAIRADNDSAMHIDAGGNIVAGYNPLATAYLTSIGIDIETDINNATPEGQPLLQANGNPDIEKEPIESIQLGYYGNFRHIGLEADINLFYNEVTNLISASSSIRDFSPINTDNIYVRHQGIEIDTRYTLNSDIHLLLTASYQDTEYRSIGGDNPNEGRFSPDKTASLQWDHKLGTNNRYSATYYIADHIDELVFQRLDLRYSFSFNIANSELSLSPVIQYRFDNDAEYFKDNLYENSTSYLLEASLKL